jgi:hypothetical protein
LQEENDTLQDRLDSIVDIASEEEEEKDSEGKISASLRVRLASWVTRAPSPLPSSDAWTEVFELCRMLSREAISPVWHKAAEGLHNICGAPIVQRSLLVTLGRCPASQHSW